MPTKVQQVSAVVVAGVVTLAMTGVTAGNLLTLSLNYYEPGSTTAVATPTDTGGTFVAAIVPVGLTIGGTDLTGSSMWYQRNAPAGAHTAVATINGSGPTAHGSLIEWSGLDTSAAVFIAAQAASSSSVVGTQSRVSGTPANSAGAGDLVLAQVAIASGTGVADALISNPPAGYTSLLYAGDTAIDIATEFAFQSAVGGSAPNTTWTWTDASTVASAGVIAFFKAAAVTADPLMSQICL